MRLFKFKLAGHLNKTVAEIDREMSSKELTEWMVFYSIEPFGGAREDYRAALISSITANVHGAKVKPDDFIKPWSFTDEQRARVDAEAGDAFSSKQLEQMTFMRSLGGINGNK